MLNNAHLLNFIINKMKQTLEDQRNNNKASYNSLFQKDSIDDIKKWFTFIHKKEYIKI